MMPEGWRLEVHESLPSTSDHLISRAEAGEPQGLAVLARQQTAGRGRQGRDWASCSGNLHVSLLLRPDEPARVLPQWGLVAAVAVAETLAALLPDPRSRPHLKWPNDVLIRGAKVAGMLVEGGLDDVAGVEWLVLGIGANLAWAPDVPDRSTTCLAAEGAEPIEPAEVACALIARLDHWRLRRAAEGFEPVRRAWMGFGPEPGTELSLRNPRGPGMPPLAGRYEGLSDDGRLLLRSDGRVHALSAGELVG